MRYNRDGNNKRWEYTIPQERATMKRMMNLSEETDGKLYKRTDTVPVSCDGCGGKAFCCKATDDTIILDPYDMYELEKAQKGGFEAGYGKYRRLHFAWARRQMQHLRQPPRILQAFSLRAPLHSRGLQLHPADRPMPVQYSGRLWSNGWKLVWDRGHRGIWKICSAMARTHRKKPAWSNIRTYFRKCRRSRKGCPSPKYLHETA